MNEKEEAYWSKRQEQKYLAGEMKVKEYYKGLERSFEQAKKEIQSIINDFYVRYAAENGVSYADAQRLLNKAEIGNLKEFIDKVNKNMGMYNQEVNNMSIKARMTRYTALEKQIDATLQQLYAIEYQHNGEELLKEVYSDSYYKTWFNIDENNGFHKEFAQIDPSAIEELIKYPFNGANFSTRLWKQKDHMLQQLNEAITTMLVQGKNPNTLSKEFAKKFDVKEYEARRLLHTEGSFMIEQGSLAAYKADGVEQYKISATLDLKTSEICREQDGKVYDVDVAITGENYPPFHPFCRTTTIPYYDDDVGGGTRVARNDKTGESYKVPADMTYNDWYEKHIANNHEAMITEKKWKNRHADKKQYDGYKEILGKEAPKTLEEFQNLKYNNSEEWNNLKNNYRDSKRYNKIVENANDLNIKGIPIRNIKRIDLNDYEFEYNHINNDRDHGVTKDMAQEFIDEAKAAYSRWNGQVVLYLSEKGCSVVNLKDKKVSTSYKNDEYDEKFKKLMEVLKDGQVSDS